jgi:hypothetical protein
MRYILDDIHSNSKATMFYKKITLVGYGNDNDNNFKELFKFFEKSFNRTNDIDGYVKIGRHIQKSEWSYKVCTRGSQHQFFLTESALKLFNFWYPESNLKFQ